MCLSLSSVSSLVIIFLQIPRQHSRKKCQRELQASIPQLSNAQSRRPGRSRVDRAGCRGGGGGGLRETTPASRRAPGTQKQVPVASDRKKAKAIIIKKSIWHSFHSSLFSETKILPTCGKL